MSNIDSEDCLYKLACECECFFDQLQDAPTTINPDLCAEFQQRFAIWAANLGALARKSQCLDTRLRDFPDLQDLVARLLDILRRNIQLCMVTTSCQDDESLVPPGFEAQYRPSEIQSAALRTIDDTLTRLNRLGVRIRQSSNSKLDARIRKFAAGVNLEPFEYLCAFAVQMLYPNAHQALKSYLGKSMAKRYATMLFINSRQETLKKRREPLPMIPEVPSGKTQTSAPATQPTRVINNSIMTSITTTHSALSQSDLSSVNIQEIRNSGRPPDEASTKRYKTSSIQINQTNYPRPPIAELDISIRTCPWCAKLLSNTLSESEWRRHVDEDFEPYICLSEECLETHPAYPNFDDWFKHMRLHSQRWHERFYLSSSWVCAVCEANPEVYTSPHALYSHMERSHSDGFTNEQLEIISRQSKLDQPRSGNDCLLCCFVVGEQAISGEVVFPKRRKRGVKQENTKASRRALEMVNPDPHSPNLLDTSSDSDDTDTPRDQSQQQNEDRSVAMARHVAAHLQTLMFLTLRFADIQNYNGRLDDDIKSDSVEIDEGNGSLERNDVARLSDVVSDSDIVMTDTTGNMDSTTAVIDIDDFVEDEIVIPDTNLDLSDIPRQYDGLMPENDDFLRKLIDSGAYQPSRIKHEIPSPVSPPPVASTESDYPNCAQLLLFGIS
ncbi:hypothetical protein F5B21DRAFT_518328 [Xylaria acuta]|nr:hypothetical protein F5B21DRAFT_518328 [Xylaria acuta]